MSACFAIKKVCLFCFKLEMRVYSAIRLGTCVLSAITLRRRTWLTLDSYIGLYISDQQTLGTVKSKILKEDFFYKS